MRAAEAPFTPKAEHVILVVWDGMRPDFINAENTPNLQALVQRGHLLREQPFVLADHNRSERHGAGHGRLSRPQSRGREPGVPAGTSIRGGPVHTEDPATIRKGDELTGGKYLGVMTVAEIARQAGQTTAVAGTKPVAQLHDRQSERPAEPRNGTVFAGKSYPASLVEPITAALGAFPPYKADSNNPKPNTEENRWTTRALLEHLWHDGVPRYSVLWLSDPDYPQHVSSPGHPAALAGIHDSDTNLGLVVAELEKRGELDKTDIFVVSDHGFSTIERTVDPVQYLNEHGVMTSKQFTSPPANGQVMSVNVGGTTGIYVVGHDEAKIAKLVDLLQQSDFAGPIFTRDALPGTFAISAAHIDSPAAADIVYSFRWSGGNNAVGTPGLLVSENKTGSGMHGSLSRYDIHNTLVAGGPDIRVGYRDEFPTGNIDVAPTLLHLLHLASPDGVDGRVLTEALAGTPLPDEKPVTKRLEASRDITSGVIFKDTHTWQQYLQTTSFAGHTYFDEGNAESKH